ncbi:MAG: hypothetical protein H7Y36_11445 [Armatimonadetes bacterium]|nr:hypothetical protein [Akkermansiaceae bacterium]
MSHFIRRHSIGLLLCLLAAASNASPFVPPDEGNSPVRRDQLPFDADTMVTLSSHFALLCQNLDLKNGAERRAAAQSLALALALDPASTVARENLNFIVEGKELPKPELGQIIQSKSTIWQIHGWLTTPEAGAHGNLFGDLMGDAAAVLDINHPTAQSLRKSPERGKWENWVAALSSFEEIPITKNDAEMAGNGDTGTTPPIPDPKEQIPKVRLNKAQVTTVLHNYNAKTETWQLQPTIIRMEASETNPEAESDKFQISVSGSAEDQDPLNRFVVKPIKGVLSRLHGSLPAEGKLTLLTGDDHVYALDKNFANLSGPGLVLANSAVSGNETEATVIAELDEEGYLTTPRYLWRMLSKLADGGGGKLVIANDAEEYLTSFLALERPEFFLKYEVLLASTPEQLIALSAAVPSEKQAAAAAKFLEIKSKSPNSSLAAYLSNRFVRQRLQEISEDAPYHLSAKLLALQADGMRPIYLSRKSLAAEIWMAVDPIQAVSSLDLNVITPPAMTRIDKIHGKCRDDLDGLNRYTEAGDRNLLAQAKELNATLRTLSRELRSRSDIYEKYKDVATARAELVSTNRIFRAELSKITGDPLPEAMAAKYLPVPVEE